VGVTRTGGNSLRSAARGLNYGNTGTIAPGFDITGTLAFRRFQGPMGTEGTIAFYPPVFLLCYRGVTVKSYGSHNP
jgi:hypothetical protein